MADQKAPQMQATLGLTGLTSNAMALIAPGAFLWLTFYIQATTGVAGQPSTAPAMWIGIFAALLLCLATAVAYAEISKLYPGTGSSYYYAEQALLSKDKAFKYARVAKFIVGWGSHLYYWVYPGVMVADDRHLRRLCRRLPLSELHERLQPGPSSWLWLRWSSPSSSAWIAAKGAGASTAVNIAINVIQISALVVFSVLALGYRANHPGTARTSFQYDSQSLATYTYQFATDQRRRHDARRQRRAAAAAGRGRQAGSLTITYPGDGLHRQLSDPSERGLRRCAAQIQLSCLFRPRSPF